MTPVQLTYDELVSLEGMTNQVCPDCGDTNHLLADPDFGGDLKTTLTMAVDDLHQSFDDHLVTIDEAGLGGAGFEVLLFLNEKQLAFAADIAEAHSDAHPDDEEAARAAAKLSDALVNSEPVALAAS